MLYLASSSPSRVALLKETNIAFEQIIIDYDESLVKKDNPSSYVQKIVLEKERQFFAKYPDLKNVLFADSIVCAQNIILTKAKSDNEAFNMLNLQSGKSISVLSAMILVLEDKKIFNLSKCDLILDKFDLKDMQEYIESKLYQGKAGAVMCEGFHKKYIKKIIGHQSTALGLNIELLKAFL
ncbi:septum formation inhibitor Maf [Campylobacter lari]|uniref:septum formation inhibitor Maf n=1 Tax=Campylobacter TaxID=194 RepID=UPI00126BF129|nr:septum formation inhibitor Maf [Campylobacter lari]MBT0826159.1 septum formation inhibitor Maf [Campylobacter lari]MBT0831046.1 septum formation inhibitor Maf [Campylobacter lari]